MPSISTNGSPSMIMRSENVPESPSSALQTMYFCSAAVAEHRAPLDAGRERRAAAAAQARFVTWARRWRAASSASGCAQAATAAVRDVVLELQRIGDADAREGQALLLLEVRDLLDRAQLQRVRLAARETRLEQTRHVLRRRPDRRRCGRPSSRPRPAARARTCRASRCGSVQRRRRALLLRPRSLQPLPRRRPRARSASRGT